MLMDVHQRGNLRFPQSLPEFQRLFPDDAACAGYLEKARWSDGFVCPHCQAAGEPFRFANRPGVLRCRKCRRDTGLTVGTVMARSHTPLSVWFWSAYLVSSQTPGMSAVQLRRQLGLSRGSTLHVVGVGNNRIGKAPTSGTAGFPQDTFGTRPSAGNSPVGRWLDQLRKQDENSKPLQERTDKTDSTSRGRVLSVLSVGDLGEAGYATLAPASPLRAGV